MVFDPSLQIMNFAIELPYVKQLSNCKWALIMVYPKYEIVSMNTFLVTY